jgi:hypothetical protein
MTIRGPGQPGPRKIAPQPGHQHAQPAEADSNPEPMPRLDLLSCHSSRDGFAALTARDRATGALISVQKAPFEHRYGEDEVSQARRIQAAVKPILERIALALGRWRVDA